MTGVTVNSPWWTWTKDDFESFRREHVLAMCLETLTSAGGRMSAQTLQDATGIAALILHPILSKDDRFQCEQHDTPDPKGTMRLTRFYALKGTPAWS